MMRELGSHAVWTREAAEPEVGIALLDLRTVTSGYDIFDMRDAWWCAAQWARLAFGTICKKGELQKPSLKGFTL
jgi:hypothetical protein